MADNRVVLLDVDGVCANMTGELLARLRWQGEDDLPKYGDVTSYYLRKFLTDRQWRMALDIMADPHFWDSLPVIEGAREGVRYFRAYGRVVFTTSPWISCPEWLASRLRWLRTAFDASSADVLCGSAKEVLDGRIFVDDRASTVNLWKAHHPDGLAIVLAQPWNETETLDNQVMRMDWSEIQERALCRRTDGQQDRSSCAL